MTYVISCPFGWICSGNRKPGCQVDLNTNISWPGRLFKLTFATCSVTYCDPCACITLPDKTPARTPAAKTATHTKACLMFFPFLLVEINGMNFDSTSAKTAWMECTALFR